MTEEETHQEFETVQQALAFQLTALIADLDAPRLREIPKAQFSIQSARAVQGQLEPLSGRAGVDLWARRSSGAPAQVRPPLARTLGSAGLSEKNLERFQATGICSRERI